MINCTTGDIKHRENIINKIMEVKRACLISGDGSWSAFGGGTLARINQEYDTVIGISTGCILAPLVALREWEVLKEIYVTTDNYNIFDRCWYKGKPFTNEGKPRKFPIFMTLLLNQKTVYTSNAMRKTIDKFFTEDYFNELRIRNKEVIVGVQNYQQVPSKIHYFSSLDEDYENYKDWIWCGSNFSFFTSLIKKSWNNKTGSFHIGVWSDGRISDLIDIDQLLMNGFKEIDIVLHRPKIIDIYEGHKINNLIDNIITNINAMQYDIEFEYFYDRIKRLNKNGVTVRVFWLPRNLSTNSMIFNKKEMLAWWEEGYQTAFSSHRVENFLPISKGF